MFSILDDDKIDVTLCFDSLLPTKLASSVQMCIHIRRGLQSAGKYILYMVKSRGFSFIDTFDIVSRLS